MLVFLAPDKARLDDLRQAARDYLAWRSIEAEKETLNLDNFQRKQAETKRAQFDEAVVQRVSESFTWVLVPSQTTSDTTVTWDESRVGGPDPLAVRVSRKLRNDESLITEYSGTRLRMDLDRVPLWRGDHVGLKQLWNDYSQYLYLPRLRDRAVLLDAIRDGVAMLTWNPDTFAYAGAFDEASGRYAGLVAGQHAVVVLDGVSVLVRPEFAAQRIEEERQPAGGHEDKGNGATDSTRRSGPDAEPVGKRVPTRFYGRISLKPVRMLRDLGDIAEAVVGQLEHADAAVTITVEIEATAEKGFGDDVRRTISENAHTLKLETYGFED
jgi:hypothetical protein